MHINNQNGFTLVQAIFIIVVLALLGTYMVRLSTVQQATSTQALLQARAYQAAKAGLEWGISSTLPPNSWDGSEIEMNVDGFKVVVTRDVDGNGSLDDDSSYNEGGVPINIYPLKSIATFANIASPDYVSRTLEVTIHD